MPGDPDYSKKLGRSKQTDVIARACGEVWSDTAVWFWRTYRKKGIWLSKYTMMRWMCTRQIKSDRGTRANPIAAKPSRMDIPQNTAENVVAAFYESLDSWRKRRGQEGVRPPHKRKLYFKAIWKSTQIGLKEGRLCLQMPRDQEPIRVDWPHPLPKRVEIGWDGKQYELRAHMPPESEGA